ncbi:MarR family winged helix-turn-helix transcriptional regulator [Polynucleobacter sinensis]|uniref:MarR family winged helix-turn-helix transcriptional regulator n=1 Tax=Polynucleobacter sinensis TaxID=1743157 RepID=UPI0012E75366|nr:MarR family transcriptional regulator [Polynucleobacter sinensis]
MHDPIVLVHDPIVLVHGSKIIVMKKMPKQFKSPLSITRKPLLDSKGKTDKQFRQLIYDLSVAGAKLEIARAHLARQLGVTSPQYNILMVVAQYQNSLGITISDVANHLHVTLSHVTTEAKKLEKGGWLSTFVNPNDRRARMLQINPNATEKIVVLGQSQRIINDDLFQNIGKAEFDNICKTLSKLVDDFTKTIKKLKL